VLVSFALILHFPQYIFAPDLLVFYSNNRL